MLSVFHWAKDFTFGVIGARVSIVKEDSSLWALRISVMFATLTIEYENVEARPLPKKQQNRRETSMPKYKELPKGYEKKYGGMVGGRDWIVYPKFASIPVTERPSFQVWRVEDLEKVYDMQVFGPGCAGICCADFSLIYIAGPERCQLPLNVQRIMDAHEQECVFHQGEEWKTISTSGTVTLEYAEMAERVIEKINSMKVGR